MLELKKQKRVAYGTLFAKIGVHERSDEMFLSFERRFIRKYDFSDDPYVEMFADIYQRHLSATRVDT